ncbi:MAG: hypothetical protein IPK63_18045 [Candidatus Competibacteraceae bacterium]|nr:hypothetical protein [Candidatus Competibacteraceae bacterium]
MEPAKRTRQWEQEKRESGWELVRAWLPPEAIKKLDAIVEKINDSEDRRCGRGKAIEELLR